MRADFSTVTEENKINKLIKYQLEVEQLRSTRIAFVEHCNEFDCFYIDLNDQLQRITIPTEKFVQRDALAVDRRAIGEMMTNFKEREEK